MSEAKEGWWWPENSRKAHYIREGRSLCGKWGCFSYVHLSPGTYADSESCKACARKLKAEPSTEKTNGVQT